ncbi:MAG: sigma-54-dependent Fis family transcriptional regulator [Polyangiaceae bacterium]|nr:sigma-54-dependent Fis family transcriptional regulator [Polyangiaceae bacterium]
MSTHERATVLVVDDDRGLRRAFADVLRSEGFSVIEAGSEPEAEKVYSESAARVVVLDLMLPPKGTPEAGAALMGRMLAARPAAKVVIVSGVGDTALSLSLVRRGAYDFIEKPADPDVLVAVIERAVARLALEDRVLELEKAITREGREPFGMLGSAPVFLEATKIAERAAATLVPVLITGESGTGKEVLARFVHAKSPRSKGPFVAVNCGALAPTLLESTLFGHKRGAFTGAVADTPGLFVEADGGTLFLDEIGDLEIALQVKLLRALEEGEVTPVGASKPVKVSVRIISATHKPLAKMVEERTFRDDLYWRIRGIEVSLPRLADRTGDLPVLAQHFLNQARALVPNAGSAKLSPESQRCLEKHHWPGNLRELRHEMQRALVMAAGREEILEEDLSPELRTIRPTKADSNATTVLPSSSTLEEKIANLEYAEIARVLAETDGNRSHAAEKLGLSRQGLLNKMARHGLR